MTLNLYTTRDDVKARAALPDTDDDAKVDQVLLAVSREIDKWTGTQFWGALQTRYFTLSRSGRVLLPAGNDLVSVTSLKTDSGGDRTYATTWAVTDFDLEPANNALKSPPEPYWEILTAPGGDYGFSSGRRGIQIVGRWGYYDVLEASSATLAESLDTTESAVDVSSGPAFKVGHVIEIDSERMEISGIAANTLTVTRAINGTTAATHESGAAIRVATFPVVGEAALHQALLLFRGSTSAPLSIQGSPEFGQQIRATGLHPFVQNMLQRFKYRGA